MSLYNTWHRGNPILSESLWALLQKKQQQQGEGSEMEHNS